MGRKSAKRGHRTFEPNVKADIDNMYGGYEGNGVDKNGSDDVLFDEMTLQELEICKGKKREVLGDNKGGDELLFDNMALQELKIYGKELKILKSAGPTKANVESSRKRNYSHSQFEDAELDLEERTCYQKSRLSKQLKVENEWVEDCSFLIKPEQESTLFTVNQDLLAVAMPRASIKCEPLLYNSGYLCGLDNIKTEIIETKSFFLQNAACFADCSATNCFADMNSSESSLELLGKVDLVQLESEKSTPFPEKMEGFLDRVDDEGELEMKESAFFNNEFLQCSLNEASTKYFEDMEESTNFTMNLSGESFDGSSDNFDGGVLEMSGSTSFTEGTPYCSLNEASTEYMEEKEESTHFIEEMGLSGESSNGFLDVRELNTEELSSTNNESIPRLNEALTHCEPGRSTFLQEIAENHCCRPFTSELMIEGLLPHELSAGNSEEIPFLNIPGSETHHNSIGPSSQEILCQVHKNTVTQVSDMAIDDSPQVSDMAIEISCQVHKNTVTQVSDMAIDDSPQSRESTDASYGCISGFESEDLGENADENPIDCEVPTDSVKDTSIAHEDHSMRGTNGPYSSPRDSKDSVTASNSSFDGCSPQDSKPSVLASVDGSAKTSIQIRPSNGTEGLNAMESFDNFHGEKPKRPPERLLSTRKSISPTCQETLRRAMTTEELYESVEISNYRRRLWFEKRTKASTTGVVLKEADVMMGHDGIIKKLKNNDDGSLPSVAEDIFTSPHACMEPFTCTGCSLNHENAQKAIRFSYHQIHDMECFVMKLMKEIKSMKYALEENSSPQPFPSPDSPSRINEMRKASLNVAGLEKITRRWHSVLTKDWKRFCNMMNLSGNQSTNSTIRNRQKKVKFADEVGGMLCHVKVFEKIQPLSSSETEESDHKLSQIEDVH